jgi:hypothetical protein
MLDKIRESFVKNPFVWVLVGLLLIVEHANYQRGTALTRACELTGPHEGKLARPVTEKDELDAICVDNQPDN